MFIVLTPKFVSVSEDAATIAFYNVLVARSNLMAALWKRLPIAPRARTASPWRALGTRIPARAYILGPPGAWNRKRRIQAGGLQNSKLQPKPQTAGVCG